MCTRGRARASLLSCSVFQQSLLHSSEGCHRVEPCGEGVAHTHTRTHAQGVTQSCLVQKEEEESARIKAEQDAKAALERRRESKVNYITKTNDQSQTDRRDRLRAGFKITQAGTSLAHSSTLAHRESSLDIMRDTGLLANTGPMARGRRQHGDFASGASNAGTVGEGMSGAAGSSLLSPAAARGARAGAFALGGQLVGDSGNGAGLCLCLCLCLFSSVCHDVIGTGARAIRGFV